MFYMNTNTIQDERGRNKDRNNFGSSKLISIDDIINNRRISRNESFGASSTFNKSNIESDSAWIDRYNINKTNNYDYDIFFTCEYNRLVKNVDTTNFYEYMIFLDKLKLSLIDKHVRKEREIEPYWVDDKNVNECSSCKNKFTILRWKHHCRVCGDVFCDNCSKNKKPIPQLSYYKPVRHCDNCYDQ